MTFKVGDKVKEIRYNVSGTIVHIFINGDCNIEYLAGNPPIIYQLHSSIREIITDVNPIDLLKGIL